MVSLFDTDFSDLAVTTHRKIRKIRFFPVSTVTTDRKIRKIRFFPVSTVTTDRFFPLTALDRWKITCIGNASLQKIYVTTLEFFRFIGHFGNFWKPREFVEISDISGKSIFYRSALTANIYGHFGNFWKPREFMEISEISGKSHASVTLHSRKFM